MIVISEIGIKDIGSFQPIRTAEGNNTKKAIRIPLIIELIFKSTVVNVRKMRKFCKFKPRGKKKNKLRVYEGCGQIVVIQL